MTTMRTPFNGRQKTLCGTLLILVVSFILFPPRHSESITWRRFSDRVKNRNTAFLLGAPEIPVMFSNSPPGKSELIGYDGELIATVEFYMPERRKPVLNDSPRDRFDALSNQVKALDAEMEWVEAAYSNRRLAHSWSVDWSRLGLETLAVVVFGSIFLWLLRTKPRAHRPASTSVNFTGLS